MPNPELAQQQSSKLPLQLPCKWASCSKQFTRKSDLQRHIRIHTNDRRFRCTATDCGKAFIQRSALTVHIRTHTGEKPFFCQNAGCVKRFSDSSALARHRHTHTSNIMYKCNQIGCMKAFARKAALLSHQKRQHQNPSSEPAIYNNNNNNLYSFSQIESHKLPPSQQPNVLSSIQQQQAIEKAVASPVLPPQLVGYSMSYNHQLTSYHLQIQSDSPTTDYFPALDLHPEHIGRSQLGIYPSPQQSIQLPSSVVAAATSTSSPVVNNDTQFGPLTPITDVEFSIMLSSDNTLTTLQTLVTGFTSHTEAIVDSQPYRLLEYPEQMSWSTSEYDSNFSNYDLPNYELNRY